MSERTTNHLLSTTKVNDILSIPDERSNSQMLPPDQRLVVISVMAQKPLG